MQDGLTWLRSGGVELAIAPFVGGAIACFDHVSDGRRWPVLRPSPKPLRSVLDAASFPLVPFSNRIRGGSFFFRGREIRLEPNMAGDPSPLHGQGWLQPWTLEDVSVDSAELIFRHEAGEWPWDYEARQKVAVDSDGANLTLSCRNLDSQPMPCGLGHHPYFLCGPETLLDTGVAHVWTTDENVLPVECVAADGRFDLSNRRICGQDLDHGFGGWDGYARLSDPDWPFAIRITSPEARFFQLYSPGSGGIVVAEPVSHANAALNAPEEDWAELGMRVLQPGEGASLTMRIAVEMRQGTG